MSFLIIPKPAVSIILSHNLLRRWLIDRLPHSLPAEFMLRLDNATTQVDVIGTCTTDENNNQFLCLWTKSIAEKGLSSIKLGTAPLLCICSDEDASTIWSVEDEDRGIVLERTCRLAEYLWQNVPLPAKWHLSSIDGAQSIFAGDFRLENYRFAYSSRTIRNRPILTIGTLFYYRRQQKKLSIPIPGDELIERIPSNIPPPDLSTIPNSPTEEEALPRERDLRITKLDGGLTHPSLFSLRYSDWMAKNGPLTKQQRRVIQHKVERPLRIHGPAGSGKTLVLLLKTLTFLREAQDNNRECRILIVSNSKEMRAQIRAAIDAIDDRSFLASTAKDPQYLDIETLHGWCIRELGIEEGRRYFLDQDPKASKQQQLEMLENIISWMMENSFKNYSDSLSADMISHMKGSRERLLVNLRNEIAIRIKGRGYTISAADREAYIRSSVKTFVGSGTNNYDRMFLFKIYQEYEQSFLERGLLDTDDIVLSMIGRLRTALWDRQRQKHGYDYVMVDETHLLNENERRALPFLTRSGSGLLKLVMTFDEAQSIGGSRSAKDLRLVGIEHSESATLRYVLRCSSEIFALARDLVESGILVFSEFATSEALPRMPESDQKRCQRPQVIYGKGDTGVIDLTAKACEFLRTHNYHRIGVIVFDNALHRILQERLPRLLDSAILEVRARGDVLAALPGSGTYVMTPEASGGLEFDAVILVGVDDGRVPPYNAELSPIAEMAQKEDSLKELYTAITRARFRLIFVCDSSRGMSSLLLDAKKADLIEERSL